jgi:hypothetical protein
LITGAVWILSLAVIAGTILALWHLRATDGASRPPLFAGLAHGVVGAVGLAFLLVALQGPARGVGAGAGSFGTTAAVLFAAALLTGIAILVSRGKAVVIAVHAGLAITGYVLLLAWDQLG